MANLMRALERSVRALPEWFPQGGRLAHLLLTSKSEGPLRDALCWDLQQQFGDDLLVVREWRRMDLGLFHPDGWRPALLVEAKLMYGFDAAVVGVRDGDYTTKIAADLHKLTRFEAAAAAIAFVVNPMARIPPSVPSISKYAGGHNRGLQQAGGAEALRDLGREYLRPALQRLGDVSCVQLDAGTWQHGDHSVAVELDAWIVAPSVR